MLRSWIDRAQARLAPTQALGLVIGRGQISATLLTRSPDTRVEWVRHAELAARLFDDAPSLNSQTALVRALEPLAEEIRGRFIPVHVALPDPIFRCSVLELEELPKTARMQHDLAQWRLQQDSKAGRAEPVCVCQYLGAEQGKHLLLAQGLDAAWLETVKAALARTGIVPWSVNQAAVYRFNHFHETLTRDKQGATLLSLDPDAYSLALWDRDGRLRLLRARWREQTAASANRIYETIVEETERAIRSYVHGAGRDSVMQLYLCGSQDDVEKLSAILESRTREKCSVLSASFAGASQDGEDQRSLMAATA